MAEIALLLGCGQTTVHKYIRRLGLIVTKAPRKTRSSQHSEAIAKALRGKVRPRKGKSLECLCCGESFYVAPGRVERAKYCSKKCRGAAVQATWTGVKSPRYQEGVPREKVCVGCGAHFKHEPPNPITSFLRQKFCSKSCADEHGFRLSGREHPNFKEDSRRRGRNSVHTRWADKVLQRDGYRCRRCGVSGDKATLHAHHVRPWEFYPALRGSLDNGISLCARCHWEVHETLDLDYLVLPSARTPSKRRAIKVSGTLVREAEGREVRKWVGICYWCGVNVVKRLSDVAGKRAAFCGRSCASKHKRAFGNYRPTKTSLPDTARPPEKDPFAGGD